MGHHPSRRSGLPREPHLQLSGVGNCVRPTHYTKGKTEFFFERSELESTAKTTGIALPKNLGDVIYSLRFRTEMPEEIKQTATAGLEWVIKLAGKDKNATRYRMKQQRPLVMVFDPNRETIKIPDATPQIVVDNALTDEQAVLAKVRYNRLIDIFLGVTAYSLQNHLRTSVRDIGQIEIDEVYAAVKSTGEQFVIPVQAKRGKDKLAAVQVEQDLAWCRRSEKVKRLTPRPVAVQSAGDVIVMFELTDDGEGDDIVIRDEKHYRLVPAKEISDEDRKRYRV